MAWGPMQLHRLKAGPGWGSRDLWIDATEALEKDSTGNFFVFL